MIAPLADVLRMLGRFYLLSEVPVFKWLKLGKLGDLTKSGKYRVRLSLQADLLKWLDRLPPEAEERGQQRQAAPAEVGASWNA